jgi:hypothetical protein
MSEASELLKKKLQSNAKYFESEPAKFAQLLDTRLPKQNRKAEYSIAGGAEVVREDMSSPMKNTGITRNILLQDDVADGNEKTTEDLFC